MVIEEMVDKIGDLKMIITFPVYATWWIMLRLTRVGITREMHVKVREEIGGGRMKKRKVCAVKGNIEFETQSRGSCT